MNENAKKMGQITAKCWADEAFKQRFKADPAAVLREQGVEVPAGMKLHVHETTAEEGHIVLLPKPSGDLSVEQLDKVAGGGSSSNSWGTFGTICIVTAATAYCH